MTAAEAKAYGLVDDVIKSRKEVKMMDSVTADGSTTGGEGASSRKVEE